MEKEDQKMGSRVDRYLPVVAMVLLQVIYAGIAIGTRTVLVEGMSPRVFVVYRQLMATLVIVPVAYFSGRNSGSWSLSFRSFCLIFLASLIGVTLNQNLLYEGLYLVSSSVASAMANLLPALTFLIAALLRMESVNIGSWRGIAKIVGTVTCVSGAVSMALLKGPKLLNNSQKLPPSNSFLIGLGGPDNNWFLGCLFLFGSSFCWSLWLILQVPASASHPNHLSLSAWMCLMAALQSGAVTLFLEPHPAAWKFHTLLEFASTVYAGVMGSAVSFFVQAWCISRRGPLFSAMFTPLYTVITTIFAAIMLHETLYTGRRNWSYYWLVYCAVG
ncbi:WAT1-related protein At4g30420-like isoform X2 [Arachis stenosperma]|uniref:WAT1-related protein At4g30420-like isoform X2 n=1 Tax=Arachis stenosperma TaxID=217475 RepID=UPI0025AB89BF|nr:WAT1-related protein At4g30420-like isoform X2 [Arachis stenosperma]